MSWHASASVRRAYGLAFSFAAAAVATVAFPPAAGAHVANVEYRFPMPVWVFALAGAGAILASVPAAALGVRLRPDWTSRNLYPALARLRLGAIGLTITSLLLVATLVAGFANEHVGFFNAATLLFWVDLWVGLGIASAFVGNVWDFVSPLTALGRALDRLLAARGIAARSYPARLGVWPAVGFVLLLSWAELVWEEGFTPHVVASFVLGYLVVQLVAMAIFGTEVWLARGELFTVLARTFARLAPLELYVLAPDEPCRARCCPPGSERLGCPACWRTAPRERRAIRLRAYGAGIRREPALGPGGSAFVVALLATVVYDALQNTLAVGKLEGAFVDLASGFRQAETTLATLMMVTVVGAFAVLFVLGIGLVARLEGTSIPDAARRYAPTLIPIAAVYFFAHYFLYLFSVGQYTPVDVLDPLGRGWFPDYRPWTGLPGSLVWGLQAGSIVLGHLIAVLEAHRVSLRVHRRPRRALATQLPLAALMITYTFTGLWVLGQALEPASGE